MGKSSLRKSMIIFIAFSITMIAIILLIYLTTPMNQPEMQPELTRETESVSEAELPEKPDGDDDAQSEAKAERENVLTEEAHPENVRMEEPSQSYTKEAKLIAVGDIMMHSPQIPAGYDPITKTYSYDSFFTEVKSILTAGDWVIGNLETPLAGEEFGFSGYPQFNAPEQLADALKHAGFNVLTTANNHSMDRREQGVLRTLENIRARGLIPVGTAASPEQSASIEIIEKNNIAMAFLAYTYGTNGIPIPEGKDYLVSLIEEQRMIGDIARARKQGADIVTVALHFGNEYERMPNESQLRWAELLIQSGADIILGSHPHVVQPYEFIETETETGETRKGIVIYSLGNFISNQDRAFTKKPTDIGVIFTLKIKKQFPEQTVIIDEVETIPTYVHRYYSNGKRNYRVLPMESVIAFKNDPILQENDYKKIESYLTEIEQHIQSLSVGNFAE
jgi:poly-gamma-glutamate capsule biosynthesis protein CapA/YwtB (metallophosphatase superfamily)